MTSSNYWQTTLARRISRRRMLAATGAAAGATLLVACAGGSKPGGATLVPGEVRKPGAVIFDRDSWKLQDESANAVPGGVYPDHQPMTEYTQPFDPMLATQATIHAHMSRVYEYLVRQNRGPGIAPGSPEYAQLAPHLAENWEVANDGLSYTFTMRPNVKFQNVPPVNGRVMTIDDWKSTYERYAALSFYRNAFHEVVDKVEFPDTRHMVFRLKFPYAPLPIRMVDTFFGALKITPRELNENPALYNERPCGTGALQVDRFQPSVTMEFKRHDEYWQGKPYIDRWHWPRIPEYANRYAQFVAKHIISLDGLSAPSGRDALQLRNDAPDAIMVGAQISETALTRMPLGKVNVQNMPYNDARVRIAMRRSLDMESIDNFRANKEAFRAAGIEVEVSFMTHIGYNPVWYLDPRKGELGPASQNHLFDVAEARKLFAAAGYPNGIELDFYQTNTESAANEELTTLIQDAWQRTGLVKLNRKQVPNVEFSDQILLQSNFTGIARPNPVGGNDPDAQWIRQWHSTGESTVWKDPKVDDIIMRQRRETDMQKRIEILKEFQRYAAETFYQFPGNGLIGSFGFWWDWLRNSNYPVTMVHKHWLAPDMPRRGGA